MSSTWPPPNPLDSARTPRRWSTLPLRLDRRNILEQAREPLVDGRGVPRRHHDLLALADALNQRVPIARVPPALRGVDVREAHLACVRVHPPRHAPHGHVLPRCRENPGVREAGEYSAARDKPTTDLEMVACREED